MLVATDLGLGELPSAPSPVPSGDCILYNGIRRDAIIRCRKETSSYLRMVSTNRDVILGNRCSNKKLLNNLLMEKFLKFSIDCPCGLVLEEQKQVII